MFDFGFPNAVLKVKGTHNENAAVFEQTWSRRIALIFLFVQRLCDFLAR